MSKTCRDINELTPTAQKACRLFLKKCEEAGLNIFITETYRSQERQNELYAQGRTEPGQIVTWTLHSRHTSRRAWDIAVNGGNLYDMSVIRKAGEIGQQLGITWGGIWSPPDYAHFEVTNDWKAPEEVEEVTQEQFNQMMETYIADRNKKPVSDWAKNDVEKAKAAGITDGTMPQGFATREQVISMIARAVEKKE